MKKILFVCWVLVVLSAKAATAQIVWEKQQMLVDATLSEKSIKVEFPYQNAGGQSVKILEVKPSCGCTTTDLKEKEVAAGEKGILSATISLDNANGGTDKKQILVRTNENAEDPINLVVVIRQPTVLKLSHKRLVLGSDKASTQIVNVAPGDVAESKVLGVRTSDDRIGATLRGDGKELVVTNVSGVEELKGSIFIDVKVAGEEKVVKIPFSVGA